ncbi:MAG: LLM class flavin-dependent oxidoreductase, partial [Gemmatimonadetes bacterium]|nr:LLM class flavin-dependent oxidoreductase [Gemmatimonadota bacterium]
MHVGASIIFQNPGKQQPDHAVWEDELALVDLVEPLGFDSVWATEHHITDYIMCPDPVQFLAYAAGRTTIAKLGTMVVVLPWRDPFRVAEQIAMLDVMSGGRVIFGMGRGAGRCEFEGFKVPMEESRARFVEAAEMIMAGLVIFFVYYYCDIYT